MKKIYSLSLLILFTFATTHTKPSWPKWLDGISEIFTHNTDNIIHKEFSKASRMELFNENGAIIINSWQQNSIAVEIIVKATESCQKSITIDTKEEDGIVKLQTMFADDKTKGTVTYNILVPKDTDIKLLTKQGNIVVKNIAGNIDAETENGKIKVINAHNNVTLKALYGDISMRTNKILAGKEVYVTTEKGTIKMCLTESVNSTISATAPSGKVTSEVPITLDKKKTTLNPKAWKAFKQEASGSLGKPESSIIATNHCGSIIIMPYIQKP